MMAPDKKRDLLEQAENLAAKLAGGEVTRSEWRHVVDALYLAPGSAAERRQRAGELIEALPGSWVSQRSTKTRKQLIAVKQIYLDVASQRLSDEELRFLVGWTSRLLYVRGKGVPGIAVGKRASGGRDAARGS